MDGDTAARQLAEIDGLQAIYSNDGEFDLLIEPKEGGDSSSFRVTCPLPLGSVLVTLPADYPGAGVPTFILEALRGQSSIHVREGLSSLVHERVGEECIFEALQVAADLSTEVDGSAETENGLASCATANIAKDTGDSTRAGEPSSMTWTEVADRGTLMKFSVNSGPKVKVTKIANLSELRRMMNTGAVCIDVASSRNTENYELAALLAASLRVKTEDVEFVAGSKKEKNSGERKALIVGLNPPEVMERLIASI
eukprot:TRINITY_DN74747_c0_g1_i1.p1 TRINITY_DN74747_c0_g1~~TRINITY_DN74747_c0_g1_i1.p1  ORF type:complete len:254 (-),score=48.76 TRINITY_DN74747_c0_g1_i1:332-1093(-)